MGKCNCRRRGNVIDVEHHLSFDRLAAIVKKELGDSATQEVLFVFHNARRTLLKMLWRDRTGYCVFYKRLDRGTYRIPLAIPPGATRVVVSAHELALLLEGIDARVVRAARRAARASR